MPTAAAPVVHYSPPWANTHVRIQKCRVSSSECFCADVSWARSSGLLAPAGQERRHWLSRLLTHSTYHGSLFYPWYGTHRLRLGFSSSRVKDSFYKTLTPEQSKLAFANEYDFDSPSSIDFDVLVEKLRDLKQGYRVYLRAAGGCATENSDEPDGRQRFLCTRSRSINASQRRPRSTHATCLCSRASLPSMIPEF
jgi:hypothetical protein